MNQENLRDVKSVDLSDDTAVAEELAKSDDITVYAEEREEQQESEDPDIARIEKNIDELKPEKKRATRYERLKRARDAAQAENAELRKRLEEVDEPSSENQQPENEYEEAIEQGRREAETADQLSQRDDYVAAATAFNTRAAAYARDVPDFQETLESIQGLYQIPDEFCQMIAHSDYGPAIVYGCAKDVWSENSQGFLDYVQSLAGNPIAQAQAFGAMEQAVRSGYEQQILQQQQQQRVTKAPAPMRPVSGGGTGAPKDLNNLAKSDRVDDYIRARRRQEA